MGKVTCVACGKNCKGQAIRLEDKHYHVTCFKCRICNRSLVTGGFYTKDNDRYCTEDYQRLYGTRCHFCNEYVEGEVVTALNQTYHEDCFRCSNCHRLFEPGDKVTFNEGSSASKRYLCVGCADNDPVDQLSSPPSLSPILGGGSNENGSKIIEETSSLLMRETVSAPVTPARQPQHEEEHEENHSSTPALNYHTENGKDVKSDGGLVMNRCMVDDDGIPLVPPLSPGAVEKLDISSDRDDTPRSSDVFDTPRSSVGFDCSFANDSARASSELRHGTSPVQSRKYCRSVSPGGVSQMSRKSRESCGSYGSRFDMNFGRYCQTYLDKVDGRGGKFFKRGPSLNLTEKLILHYHRPTDNFSYKQSRSDIHPAGRNSAQSGGTKGVLSRLDQTSKTEQQYISALRKVEPYQPIKTQEPIQLSKIPNAKTEENHVAPIDRDDWPAPPAPAAAYPELLREHHLDSRSGSRRISGTGSRVASDSVDGGQDICTVKVDREIEELSKMTDSGAAQVILGDLKRQKTEGATLDPRSSSRTPNAAVEPSNKPRYDSPVFASPSRNLDYRECVQSPVDGFLIERKYRTTPVPTMNSHASSSVSDYESSKTSGRHSSRELLNNVSTTRSPRVTTSATGYSRNGLSCEDVSAPPWRPRSVVEVSEHRRARLSVFSTSQTSVIADGDYDPMTGLRRRVRAMTLSTDGGLLGYSPAYLGYRRSVPNLFRGGLGGAEEPLKVYPYERLKDGNLPPDVEKNSIERHLSKEEFEKVFAMSMEQFYRLAEWKRNDIKMRVKLY